MISVTGGGMAKQPEETRTLELDLGVSQPITVTKRGRGWPRDPDALTNAERQQRWRDKQKRIKRKGVIPAKYRDPETGQTWSGRGLAPKWITVTCARLGVDRSYFLVKS